jgi:hypothetical protein
MGRNGKNRYRTIGRKMEIKKDIVKETEQQLTWYAT